MKAESLLFLAASCSVAFASGCAQILGLDKTEGKPDASIDAASICDTPLDCTGAPNDICGRLIAPNGTNFTVTSPVGEACVAGGEGPCSLELRGRELIELNNPMPPAEFTTTIDDCGRFRMTGVDGLADKAVVLLPTGTGLMKVATLVRRTMKPAPVQVLVIDNESIASMRPEDRKAKPAILFRTPLFGNDRSGWSIQFDNGDEIKKLPLFPGVGYFSDGFSALELTLDASASSGTAFVDPAASSAAPAPPLTLAVVREGKRCSVGSLINLSGDTSVFIDIFDLAVCDAI